MRHHNPNCDGNGPHMAGEVRVLPLAGGSNLHVCLVCYHAEIAFRRDRNRKLMAGAVFELPRWESLVIAYEAEA